MPTRRSSPATLGFTALLAAALAGCRSEPNAAARLARVEGEPPIDLELSPDEQAEVIDAMQSVAVDHAAPAERSIVREMRWSDLPGAVATACDEEGVEMVVIAHHRHEWGDTFELRTADDQPARLEVRRTGDDRLYTAAATVGRFQSPADRERAQRLLRELDRAMVKMSHKRRLRE